MLRKLFDVLESCKFCTTCSFLILSFFSSIFDSDSCLLNPLGVNVRLSKCVAPQLIFRFNAIMGLKFRFCSVALGFLIPSLELPESFSLLRMAGDLAGTPILWTFTGVEFSWDPGFIMRVRTGVEAFSMPIRGFTRWLAFIWVGGWILDWQFLLKSMLTTNYYYTNIILRYNTNPNTQGAIAFLQYNPIPTMSQMKLTYDRHLSTSLISKNDPEMIAQKLTKFQTKIFQKENQIDSGALQQYLNSIRTSKQGKQREISQKTQISYIITNVFALLKKMMVIPQNDESFDKILSVYTDLIKSRENSRHYFVIIEEHLKEVLNIDIHRKNKKLYKFITKVFEFNPYVVYKILQSKPEFLEWNSKESLEIYKLFIRFAADKKNSTLILKQVKKCIERDSQQLQRLKILLRYLPSVANQALIMDIHKYINQIINGDATYPKKQLKDQFYTCLLKTIELFVSLPWPEGLALNKNDVIIKFLTQDYWRTQGCEKQSVNIILNKLEITNQSMQWMESQIRKKVKEFQKGEFEKSQKEKSQSFKSLEIMFSKLGKQKIEDILTKQEVQRLICRALSFPPLEQTVNFLGIIKSLEIYSFGSYIHSQLKNKIETILGKQTKQLSLSVRERACSTKQQFQSDIPNLDDKRLALRALRRFKFDSAEVYMILKEYVLKNDAIINKSKEIKREVIKACLYFLTYSGGLNFKMKIMRAILNLINKDLQMKKVTVEWFKQNQNLYDKQIFQIFKQKQYLHTLFQYYASNHMILKRFSIKVLCYIYPLEQCDIVPFLKRVYNHIYDRLSSDNIVSFEEKKEALRLTREILRHRTEIIYDDASALCNFLYNHLYRAQDYDQTQMNQILIQLLKTIIDLIRKIPKNVLPYAHPIADYIIKLLNSKDSQEKVKTVALSCFNQLIRGCSYVLIPYFHFKNLFDIIREIFREGARGIDHQEILRLLGNLGIVTKEKYERVKALVGNVSNPREINKLFEKVFKETTYTKQIRNEKQVDVIENSGWNGPFLFTKQQTTYTYVQITNFKQYILAKINKILSENPSKIINSKVFRVLESFTCILNKEQQKMYQETVLAQILKPQIIKQSSNSVFSLVSKIVRCQSTEQNCNIFLKYLLTLYDDKKFSKKYQLAYLVYILTQDYPNNERKDDSIVRKVVSRVTQHISKAGVTVKEIKIALKIIENLAECTDNLIHLFLPQFNKSFLCHNPEICLCYFQVLLELAQKAPSTEFYLPPITQSLIELLRKQIQINRKPGSTNWLFIQKIIDFGLCLMLIYGDRFKGFVSEFRDALKPLQTKHLMYSIAQQYMKKHSTLNYLEDAFNQYQIIEMMKKSVDFSFTKTIQFETNQLSPFTKKIYFAVIEEFSCDKNQIQDQSEEWFNKICISMFEKSPELFVHKCLLLVKDDRSFCYDIFPIAFYFFWTSLCLEGQRKLSNKLKIILESKVISLGVKQKILDTIYFMAQWKASIPLKNKFLFDVSISILDSAKALFYMQSLFESDPETYGESLIKMYAQLQEKESAIGLLNIVQNLNTKTKILLNQKLKRHHDALKEYDRLEDVFNPQNMIMQITIRKQMLDWQSVMKLCSTQEKKHPAFKVNLAPLAVEASINLGKWQQVRYWLPSMPQNHDNLNLWKTMFKIQEKSYAEAEQYIAEDRKTIYARIGQLFNFSFQRSMEGIVRLQQLCQLEEATAYLKFEQSHSKPTQQDKKIEGDKKLEVEKKPELDKKTSEVQKEMDKKSKQLCLQQKKKLESLWNDRIQGSKKNLNAMQLLLMTRNLLLSKSEDINNWIDYCHLALKQNQSTIAKKTLEMLDEELTKKQDMKKKFEIETLLIETKFILGQLKDEEAVAQIQKNIQEKGGTKSDQSICRLYYNCAMWLSQKQYDFTIEKGNKCIEMLKKTTHKLKNFIKGWHMMGLMHLKIDQLLKEKKKAQKKINRLNDIEEADISMGKEMRETHIFQALHSFIKSVSCGIKNHGFFLQDCLKIMNILFNENEVVGLVQELHKNYTDIPADGLIDIIPQIIGRLDIVEKPKLLDMMKKLLVHIGQNHPQALVFYLVFLRRGKNETRKKIAEDIFKQITKKQNKQSVSFPVLYDETQKIVAELCKVSLKLNQKFKIWMQKLYQESSTLNLRIIAQKYLRVCQKFRSEPIQNLSISQFGFMQQYKQEMSDIINCLQLFLAYSEYQFFRKAQRILIRILNQLNFSLKQIKKISLEQTSPVLMKTTNTHVCIPGFYAPNEPVVYISSFYNELAVINSKQRPKKLIIIGSDGKEYLFLLKGKEDLRLDQRIMQLFNLINKMFHDPIERENYSIKGYSITPISFETGLIQWVQNCDTIGDLILDHRSSTLGPNKRFLELEISERICKDYKTLPKAHKVQIYKQIEQRVSGNDLKNIFWIRSSNTEQWLKNRSCYTRSLAVMSVVGYVIGLGDRHPYNIMIQRNTGKVVHIDFGDCFDVNRTRSQFPEKVPFRLTRMLVKNMEPCGIHGIFKHTCQKIIKMLRNNKQSIIAIIEAFRYDPIIGWRLKGKDSEQMLQNSYQNNQTQQSYLQDQKDKDKQKPDGDSKNKGLGNNEQIDFAQHILNEIKKKLGGKSTDETNKVMTPQEQVSQLIKEAMSPENLVEHYSGWLIYW